MKKLIYLFLALLIVANSDKLLAQDYMEMRKKELRVEHQKKIDSINFLISELQSNISLNSKLTAHNLELENNLENSNILISELKNYLINSKDSLKYLKRIYNQEVSKNNKLIKAIDSLNSVFNEYRIKQDILASLSPFDKTIIEYMSKYDDKVYKDILILDSYGTWDQNFTISGTEKRPSKAFDGRVINTIPRYYIFTFYMSQEKYASVFENHIGADLPFDLNDFDEHKGEVYQIEYVKRNWVENYETPSSPSEGKFLTKITLIE